MNYSSDIDLLGFYESDSGRAGPLTLHEFFVKHLQRLTRALQDKTEDGFLYRVDWDLRPEGRAGALINSITALEQYYETFGAEWERQAMSKALLAAGSPELGEAFLQFLHPFVYRKYLDLKRIERIREMKEKIHADLNRKTEKGFNVKLGVGGIREIEFFVQAFLLIYGGKDPSIRGTNTLLTLERLSQARYVSQNESKILRDAYLFLRKLENRLQFVDEGQTHILPSDPAEQLKTARRMGYSHDSGQEAMHAFAQDLKKTTSNVHRIFSNLFSEKSSIFIPMADDADHRSHPVRLLSQELHDELLQKASFEERLECIRDFKARQTVPIVALESSHAVPRREILLRLSVLAEAIVQQALWLAQEELRPLYGDPISADSDSPSELIILSMGKMGGYEINYSSDLDLVFIFSEHGTTKGPKEISNSDYFARLAQKFISILGVATRKGIAYAIDTELRPSGHSGMLVTTLESFMDYQRNVSQTWERQSLLRARPIGGSPHLSRLVKEHVNALLFFTPYSPDIRDEMRALRLRVENEIAKETPKSIDIKLGKGGIMDIEYILQYQQLLNAGEYSDFRRVNTFDGLDKLIQYNFLANPEDALVLKEAYTFYRTLESKLAIHLKRGLKRLSTDAPILGDIAAELGMDSHQAVLDQINAYRKRVREIYGSVFNPS